jgi:hypothetical protein
MSARLRDRIAVSFDARCDAFDGTHPYGGDDDESGGMS